MTARPIKGFERRLEPLDLVDLVRYAGAAGDFNPIHVDPELARAQGFPSNFAHGMFTAGLLGVAVGEHYGPRAIRGFGVRFVAPLYPGATPVVSATPVGDPPGRLDLTVTVDDEPVLTGWAELDLDVVGVDRPHADEP